MFVFFIFFRDEEQIAQIVNLFGEIPRNMTLTNSFFDTQGKLKHKTKLKPRSLQEILVEKYKWSSSAAREFADFLKPMFPYDPNTRATAAQCLEHPWLQMK